jgi:hypothetical protein
MHKKIIQSRSAKFLRFASLLKSWQPVNRNGWWIKFSTHSHHNILLTFVSGHTGQTIIRYFGNEIDAVAYINYIINLDSTEELNQEDLPE